MRKGAETLIVPLDLVRASKGVEPSARDVVDLGVPRLPIFIRIADYIRWDKNILPIERFIGSHHNQKMLPFDSTAIVEAITHDCLDIGKTLVILDGLDEVSDPEQRRSVMEAVNHFIECYGSRGNLVLLTSRIVGYQFQPLTHLPHYTVEDMDDAAISAFCRAWMAHADLDGHSGSRGRLEEAIFQHSHPGVRALAGNPLLLTILAQVYQDSSDRSLPARRVDLFDEALHVLYKRRAHLWDKRSITEVRLTLALGAVASHIHTNEPTGFTEKGAVIASLRSVLTAPEQVADVLDVADEGTGFLVSRGEGVYGFLHRGLQEFLVAKYLVENPESISERLASYALDPTWREPLVLAVGLISQPRYPTTDRGLLTSVLTTLLDVSDPAGEVLPRRELLVAAACAECGRVPSELAQRLIERLLSFYVEPKGRTRSQVLIQRIHKAVTLMSYGPAREGVEIGLCKALNEEMFERRYASCNIILSVNWDSQQIARALVRGHNQFWDSSGSFLVALYNISQRHAEYFRADFLPFRAAVERDSHLWQKVTKDHDWSALVRALYLPPDAELEPNRINRESPLTEYVLTALRQLPGSDPLASLRASLRPLANGHETALAADAALALMR